MPTKGCHVVRADLLKNWRNWQEGRFNIDLKVDPKRVLMRVKGSVPLFSFLIFFKGSVPLFSYFFV